MKTGQVLRNLAVTSCALWLVGTWVLATQPAVDAFEMLRKKADPWILKSAEQGDTEFLVFLTEQADLSPARRVGSKEGKGSFAMKALMDVASRTQQPVLDELKALGAEVRPFWVANMIWVRGGYRVAEAMALRPDVAHLYANPTVRLNGPESTGTAETGALIPEGLAWNLATVKAPEAWALGFTGQGVVVAGQDTGFRWNHKALKNHYRGWDGKKASHAYNWHDAIHANGGTCGHDAPAPCDDYGHGTHTMGTMVGDDGKGNQVGVAPGATWIGCRNMDRGAGTPSSYSECFQWFLAPTDSNDQNPDPSKAPHVINNSWGCPASEGCTDPGALLAVVQNVRAAGIVVVVSAGNAGPGCSTVNDPPAIYDESFSVGATDAGDAIAPFSSRGPVTLDGSGRMKPDISAPGVDVLSCTKTTKKSYGYGSGTSMAGPHVAGLTALVLSARPELKGQVEAVEEIMRQSSLPLTTSEGCGGDSETAVPNHTFGWGRMDSLAAVQSATASPAAPEACTGEPRP